MLHVSSYNKLYILNQIFVDKFYLTNFVFFSNLDNTNNLKFELYVVHAEVDGTGFPLAYLFIENNGNCGNGIWTGIIIDFLTQLKCVDLSLCFF